MNNILTSDMDTVFEKVYQKLSSPDFGKNLGGELPLYIQPIPVSGQSELNTQVERLISRLSKLGRNSNVVDLYRLALDIIDKEGILETLLEDEKSIDKDDLNATFESIFDTKEILIPRMRSMIEENKYDFVFMTGVGRVYPFIRSHSIVNNMEGLVDNANIVLFFPGEYNRQQISLFGKLPADNHYRAHNLNDIKTIYDNL